MLPAEPGAGPDSEDQDTGLQRHTEDARHPVAHALLEAAVASAVQSTPAKQAEDNDPVYAPVSGVESRRSSPVHLDAMRGAVHGTLFDASRCGSPTPVYRGSASAVWH